MARLCRSRRRKFRRTRRPAQSSRISRRLAGTSIDPTMSVVPTPNTSACAESMTMDLSTPGTMAPANATGAAATPGVSPATIGLLRGKPTGYPDAATATRDANVKTSFMKCYLMVRLIYQRLCFLMSGPPRLPPEAVFRWPQSRRRTPRLLPPNKMGGAVRLFDSAIHDLQVVDMASVSGKRTVPGATQSPRMFSRQSRTS